MVDAHRPHDPVGVSLRALAGAGGLQVVDVGGGSGTWAVPLAVAGNQVTVVDPSINALATLHRRAAEAGVEDRITSIQADTDALRGSVPDLHADLILCHHVLEKVDDPAAALSAMAAGLRAGGTLSLLVAGRSAAVIALSVAGRYADAAEVEQSADGSYGAADPVRRRFDAESLRSLLAAAELELHRIAGIGVVAGLVPSAVVQSDPRGAERLAALDLLLSERAPLCEIATDLHVLAHRLPAD